MRRDQFFKCVVLLLCALPAAVWAQEGVRISASQPFIKYTTVDGMTQAQATAFAQDEAGYLWFTTLRGLNRFDGREFGHLTISDGLRTNELTAVHALPGNTLLVGDVNGYTTVVYDGRITATIEPPKNLQGAITEFVAKGATAYMSMDGVGLVNVDLANTDQPAAIAMPTEQPISDLAWHKSNLYFIMANNLCRYDVETGRIDRLVRASASKLTRQGVHWLVSEDGTVGTYEPGEFKAQPLHVEGEVFDIDVAPNGTVWVLTSEYLVGFNATNPASDHAIQTYPNIDASRFLLADRENLVWLSAESRVQRLQGNRFQHYDLRTGPASQTVWAVSEDSAGRMYFGTHETILRLDKNEFLFDVGRAAGIPSGHVRDIVRDRSGMVWAGVRSVGLYRFDPYAVTAELIPGTEGLEILDLQFNGAQQLWLGTHDSGLFQLDTKTLELTQRPVPENGAVYALDADEEGGVWYGVDDVGLVRLVPDGTTYDEVFYGADSGLDSVSYTHVVATSPSSAWIGGIDGALYRFDAGDVENIGPRTPLHDQSAYVIYPLDADSLIVGGELGLYLIDTNNYSSMHFGTLDGFLALETNAHATYQDSQGHLWLGTVNGVTRMNTAIPIQQRQDLNPQVVSVRANSGQQTVRDGDEVSWAERDIAIRYAAVSLDSPRGIEYSYRLSGMHDDWLPATTMQSIEFTGLAPGHYRFDIRARYEGKPWGMHAASHSFSILKPFWLETWFIFAALFAFGLLINGIMRLRTRAVTLANQRLREEVMARTKSIVDANNRLETSNLKLAREIEERRKSDDARAEIESQMQLAFDHTPIGMGMLSSDGELLGANPALRELLWPDQVFGDQYPDFLARLGEESHVDARELLRELTKGVRDSGNIEATCTSSTNLELQTSMTLTAVTNADGSFRYALLHMQDITEARKLTDLLEIQANYDELTGLLNRRAFEVELTNICTSSNNPESVSYLLFMDLDRFKLVNDTSGHSAGDALLKEVADIMRSKVRASDTLGRLGGDEFGLILRGASRAAVTRIAEALRVSIEEHRFHWEAETHRIGISIGVVPIDSSSVNELEQLADGACYSAKNEGRNCVYFVEKDETSVQQNRGEARWVQRLRAAMENRQFALYGQIIKPLREELAGPQRIEVLLRMRDPATRKLIPPGAFLPAAERYGLSTELDQWVVSSLLDTLFVHDAFGAAEHCYWVNLSGASIGDKRFADFLVSAMKKSPLPPGMVNFEITETAVIRNLSEARRLIVALRDMGCQFALDDFGSGLSSFGYLKRLPVDCVKIDGMFIRDIVTDDTDRIFVKSIIDIAATMGIMSVAEFVEDEAILKLVSELGADYAQGFGVHRPEMISPEFPGNALIPLGSEPVEAPLIREQQL